ncbi:MAG: hypothetical protein MJB14_14535 [Spirochaetes bacterium]|nr:hypothetical protein [Spirochaetota bacterium]
MNFILKFFKKQIISQTDYALLEEYKKILQNKTRKILLEATRVPELLVSIDQRVLQRVILQAVYYVKHTIFPNSILVLVSEPKLMKHRLRNMGGSLLIDPSIAIDSFTEEMDLLANLDNIKKVQAGLGKEALNVFHKNLQALFKLAANRDGALFFNTSGELCGTLQNIEGVTRQSVEHILEVVPFAGSGTAAAAFIASEVPDTLAVKISGEGDERGRIIAFLGPKIIFQFNPKKGNKPEQDLFQIMPVKKGFFGK